MANSAPPDEQELADRRGRRRFHLALVGGFIPGVAALVSWTLAFRQDGDGPVRWQRLLYALAIFDSVVLACLMWKSISQPTKASSHAHRRIGVVLTPVNRAGRVTIASVTPGTPAEKAGLRRGDSITRLDGKPVVRDAGFENAIAHSRRGETRHLRVQRGSSTLEVNVVPRLHVKSPPPRAPPPLFARVPGSQSYHWRISGILRWDGGGALATLLALALVAAVAWRRRQVLGPVAHVALGMFAFYFVAFAVYVGLWKMLGLSLGVVLVRMLAATLTLLLVARVAMRRLDAAALRAAQPEDPLGTLRALGRGVFYAVTGIARAMTAIYLLAALPHLPDHGDALQLARSWGIVGIALFVLAVVFVAPLAEECLFRGVLLPWLASWMKPWPAIVVSAVVFGVGHLRYGVGFLLPLFYGVVFAWLRLRTGKLRSSVALHMLINGTLTVLVLAWSGPYRKIAELGALPRAPVGCVTGLVHRPEQRHVSVGM